jgi:hypothetical protein
MRRVAGLTLLLVLAVGLWGCSSSAPKGLPGAWELVTPAPAGAVNSGPLIKVLTDKYFAFGRRAEDGTVWAGGGTYTFDGIVYTEKVAYHSIGVLVGMTVRFNDHLEGDRWYHKANFDAGGQSFNIDEVWRRVD